jgi:2'-5' RNA ligase
MRLFIGIEIPRSVKNELAKARDMVREQSLGGRFVPTENMHVTLHFIGESNDAASAVAAMHESVRGIRPFTLKTGKYGFFGSGNEKTCFISVEGDLQELNALYESLESALADRGFRREFKKYRPHITMGRAVKHDSAALGELSKLAPELSFTADSIVLFESERVNGQMVYTPMHREKF